MKTQAFHHSISCYALFPRAVCTGKETAFTLRGRGMEYALTPGASYLLRVIPHEENNSSVLLTYSCSDKYDGISARADDDGILHFTYLFEREQTYTLRLHAAEGDGWKQLIDLRVYAADPDLWERTPMRGNTHCHACPSVDGTEEPAMVAAMYRKAGFDYLAITDHHLLDGSLIAIDALKDFPTGLTLYKGEEVHVPDAYIHAVNVGADFGGKGLNTYYNENRDVCNAEVAALAETLPDDLPFGVERMDLAWRCWIAKMIHEKGGIAIAAHPFWIWEAHNTRNAMLRYLAKHHIFDAMEVLGGQEPGSMESNLQIAFWNDMRADGIYMPIVGCDDAHTRHMTWNSLDNCFNMAWTVIFAKEPSFDGFAESIRGGYSAAVDNYDGTTPNVVGTYRLVRYTVFLLEQYFPVHDELCFTEGQLLWDACQGDDTAHAMLADAAARVKTFESAFFGREENN